MAFLIPALLTAASLAAAPDLTFEVREHAGERVLLAYDCGAFDGRDPDRDCRPWESAVHGAATYVVDGRRVSYEGDAARLRRELANGRIDAVWFASGGGNLAEGIEIARRLRERGTAVRVPSATAMRESTGRTLFRSGGVCASACTTAFMGGVLRTVDPDASFVVHAASTHLGLSVDDVHERTRGRTIDDIARSIQAMECELTYRLLRLYQNAFRPPGTALFNESPTDIGFADCRAPRWYDDDTRARDMALFEFEGVASFQDVAMRLERQAVGQAIDYWSARRDELGPGAADGLALIAQAHQSRIISAVPLTPEQLITYGWVTRAIERRGGAP